VPLLTKRFILTDSTIIKNYNKLDYQIDRGIEVNTGIKTVMFVIELICWFLFILFKGIIEIKKLLKLTM
jgi:hypothetical protein